MLNPELKTDNLIKSANVKTRSFDFSKKLINLCKNLPDQKIYWIIEDQLLRSGTSIGANLIEAKAASSRRDFVKFFQIALKSANETEYWLLLLKDETSLAEEINELLAELEEIAKMIGKSLLTLKNKV